MTDDKLSAQGEICCAETNGLTAQIVSAYVSKNAVQKSDLPDLIASVRSAIGGGATVPAQPEPAVKASPADIKKSVTPDALISFLDGKPYKTLKRHIGKHGLTVEQYRARFGLPVDYPLVAPNYSAKRSALAKSLGLGSNAS
jgi:predicted transcriptional regulator